MRFLHTADWHIGKKLNDFDLLEDQQAVFEQLVETAETHKVDAIIIAGISMTAPCQAKLLFPFWITC